MTARALVTARIPRGTVWMHDGCRGLNDLTSGDRGLSDRAVGAFEAFSGGQAAFDATVDVTRAAR
jgi:hypothetical protein